MNHRAQQALHLHNKYQVDVEQSTQLGWEPLGGRIAAKVIIMKASAATIFYLAVVMMSTSLGMADGQEVDERFGAGYDATILLKMRAKASF